MNADGKDSVQANEDRAGRRMHVNLTSLGFAVCTDRTDRLQVFGDMGNSCGLKAQVNLADFLMAIVDIEEAISVLAS
jgi:hypothetical protein